MHYTPHIDLAFDSVEYIMRDVKNGWLLRYIHANGASMFFIVVYCHIGRGLYYGSYMFPRKTLWCSGVVIFLLMMAVAFTGARVRHVLGFSFIKNTLSSIIFIESAFWKPVKEMFGHA
jgi:quinol-cytochrome oxidoreductase complex cytochrome b subunit